MRLIPVAVCAAVSLSVGALLPAIAAADGFGLVECRATPAECRLEADTYSITEATDADPDEEGAADWLSACRFELAGSSARTLHEGQLGTWYYVQCPGQPTPQFPIFFADQAPAASASDLALQARNRLALPDPDIRMNPTRQLVGLPAWFWLASWSTVSATASVPGVSAEATATPRSATWSVGDGSQVVCGGPGTAFDGHVPSAPSPDCGHTFRQSSRDQPGGAFRVTVMIEWSISWSGAGQGGELPPLFTTADVAVAVAEVPALNTSGRTDGWGADW